MLYYSFNGNVLCLGSQYVYIFFRNLIWLGSPSNSSCSLPEPLVHQGANKGALAKSGVVSRALHLAVIRTLALRYGTTLSPLFSHHPFLLIRPSPPVQSIHHTTLVVLALCRGNMTRAKNDHHLGHITISHIELKTNRTYSTTLSCS